MRRPAAHNGEGKRRVYVAFGGGGAKGIVHIGALKALETRDLEIKGVAGTSIGAVIAALVCAGYRADDIVDPEGKRSLMTVISRISPTVTKPTDLFGPGRWRAIWCLREAGHNLKLILIAGMAVSLMPIVGLLIGPSSPAVAYAMALTWLAIVCVFIACLVLALRGLASLKTFRYVLNRLLQERLFPNEEGREVLMEHLDGVNAPALKVVTANLTTGRLALFSAARTPKMGVARAVSASISLPVIFRLPRILFQVEDAARRELCTDGGIVSNLPAWPFDEERELDPDALTVAVEIPDQVKRNEPQRLTWPLALLRTGFFGGGELDLRAANAIVHLPLEADIGLLGFDIPLDEVFEKVADARRAADLLLLRALRDPELYTEACEALHSVASAAFAASPGVLDGGVGRLRVAIVEPEEGFARSLRVRHLAGFGDGPDHAVLLPMDTVAGKAWASGHAQLERKPFQALEKPEHQQLRRLMRPDLEWIFSVPIFAPNRTKRFVICFDGNTKLSDTDETLNLFKELGKVCQKMMGGFLLEENDHV